MYWLVNLEMADKWLEEWYGYHFFYHSFRLNLRLKYTKSENNGFS